LPFIDLGRFPAEAGSLPTAGALPNRGSLYLGTVAGVSRAPHVLVVPFTGVKLPRLFIDALMDVAVELVVPEPLETTL